MIVTDLITGESEMHGWVSKMPCPMLSHIGTRAGRRLNDIRMRGGMEALEGKGGGGVGYCQKGLR